MTVTGAADIACMTNTRTIAASILISVMVGAPAVTAPTAAMRSDPAPAVAGDLPTVENKVANPTAAVDPDNGATVIGGTRSQREAADWAIGRFEYAGLTVPSIEIHLHPSDEPCGGHRGIFSSGSHRVDVCVEEPAVILHEIAHAWNHLNLSEPQRSEYVSVGGFGSWDDPETPWSDRGSEDAADRIAWALLDDPIAGFTADGPIARANAAYRLLTGQDAPRVLAEEPT